jgi:hypothetical protein
VSNDSQWIWKLECVIPGDFFKFATLQMKRRSRFGWQSLIFDNRRIVLEQPSRSTGFFESDWNRFYIEIRPVFMNI